MNVLILILLQQIETFDFEPSAFCIVHRHGKGKFAFQFMRKLFHLILKISDAYNTDNFLMFHSPIFISFSTCHSGKETLFARFLAYIGNTRAPVALYALKLRQPHLMTTGTF